MEKRFGAAVFAAVVLHAALIGLTVLRRYPEAPHRLPTSMVASAAEVEIFMLAEERTSSMDEPSDRKVQQSARVAQRRVLSQRSGSAPDAAAELDAAGAPDPDATLAELGPGAGPERSIGGDSEARPRVDLGLDGSVMRRAALDARERAPGAPRAPRRRTVFSLGHWSESVVLSLAQKSAPWEGRALLTLEWDAKGQLLSVRSSAASSSSDEWQRLAQGLSSQLAARPNVGAQGTGLRVVYLIKSDLVLPDGPRSVLPAAKYASAEQLREDNLPPANTINLGVKADGSAAKTRVVSVELVRSDAL